MANRETDVIVIGGGASGMMAAEAAGSAGASVLLLEKNEKLGKKLYITGKGRCNFTNDCETEDFFTQIPRNGKFLYSTVYGFSPKMAVRWFEEHGLRTKTERGGRVFPESDHASDVTKTLETAMRKAGVRVRLHAGVSDIRFEEARACGVRLASGEQIDAPAVVIATGGLSYPSTGSTGDGYRFAEEAGHKVTSRVPALVPLRCREEDLPAMQGLSLKNVRLTISDGGRKIWEQFGEMMFTHFGVTGPLVLTASSDLADRIRSRYLAAEIDLKPALVPEKLDQRLLREFTERPNREIRNVLTAVYPQKMIQVLLGRSGMDPDEAVHDVTRQQRESLVENTKHFRFTITGTEGFPEAVITHGGVCVREIDPGTMASRKKEGLYFAGEVLDVDGHTGGYNLQIAWATGRAAGVSAAGYAAGCRQRHSHGEGEK